MEAERQLYMAVVRGEVRALHNEQPLSRASSHGRPASKLRPCWRNLPAEAKAAVPRRTKRRPRLLPGAHGLCRSPYLLPSVRAYGTGASGRPGADTAPAPIERCPSTHCGGHERAMPRRPGQPTNRRASIARCDLLACT